MDKIILKAQNREELDQMIKRTITLSEDESVRVNVVKEPKKIMFFNIKGTYEVEIVRKPEIQENKEKVRKPAEKNIRNKEKEFENRKDNNIRTDKKSDISRNNHPERRNENSRNSHFEKSDKKDIQNKKVHQVQNRQHVVQSRIPSEEGNIPDTNYDRIRSFMKEFIVNSKLDLTVVKVEKSGERYVVNVDGKDIRYLIGEKGSTLNSIEYLLSSVKPFKNIKVVIDSNNYKEKREESLRELARKKGKKVLTTGRSIKLNPMSARERKIIHEEISFIKGLRTESVGEEPKRYLVIRTEKD